MKGRAFPDQTNNVLTYILNAPLLKTDGTQDGKYALNVKATDALGNTKTYSYQIIYDTQVPTLSTNGTCGKPDRLKVYLKLPSN